MFQDNQIIITSPLNKINLLKQNNKQLLNIKIYSLNEFYRLYYFDYNEETIYYIMTKYQVKYDIAKIYLHNLYYLDNQEYQNSKLRFLFTLKQELSANNLLTINKLFQYHLHNKSILIYNLPLSKELSILKDKLSLTSKVTFYTNKKTNYHHIIHELNTLEEEVVYVANSICQLLKKHHSIDHIYLTNLDSEYRCAIKRIFPMFNLPVTLQVEDSLYSTFIVTKFFTLYQSDLSLTLTALKDYIDSPATEEIYNKIISIINKYTFVEDKLLVKEMIKSDLKNTKLSEIDIPHSIHEVDLKDTLFTNEDYVYLLSFNQGIIPHIYKDEEYLTDNDKKELSISLTVDKNNLERQTIFEKISSIPNLLITYKKKSNGETFLISSLNELLNYDIIVETTYDYTSSNTYNRIKLSSLLDEYYKYGTTSQLLNNLNNHYQDLPYKTYSHVFTGLKNDDLQEYLHHKLTLSYSSLDKYYRCPFSYYISNILKLNISEETFYQLIGNIFHHILEKFTTANLSYEELWNQEITLLNKKFTPSETFFLNKLKQELIFVIECLKEEENYTNLHNELHEEKVCISLSGSMSVTFKGIIDKIKYKEDDDSTIVAIIDYKTGNPHLDLTTIPYGIGMQLPVYLYLTKHNPKLKNIKVAGFYIQKILNNEVSVDNTHTYEQLRKKNLLLQGYSNADLSILSEFDSSASDSKIIKSMRLKTDNSFYNYCKVLTTAEMMKITDITEQKIKDGVNLITQAQFPISPKKIGDTNYGCNFCQYKDICFHTNDDIEELNPYTLDEILERSDSHGLD